MIIRRTGDKPETTRKKPSVSGDPSWNLQKYLLRKQNSSLRILPEFLSFFSTNYSFSVIYFSTPPGACQNEKTPSHFTGNPTVENRPEQALIRNRGRRFEITQFAR